MKIYFVAIYVNIFGTYFNSYLTFYLNTLKITVIHAAYL